jgi:hypothetical protein
MKILFVLRHAGFVRIFEPALRLLCRRGHAVHVGFLLERDRHWMAHSIDFARQLAREHPQFSCGYVPLHEDAWAELGRKLRGANDYLRYLTPQYRNAEALRERAAREAPGALVRLTRQTPFNTRAGLAAFGAAYRYVERCIPVGEAIGALLDEQRPDLLLCSPLIEPRSPQREYVRAARARGIRTVFCVASWDNLTNKGLIYGPVDFVTVWNHEMKREAVELHGVPPERVAVTGAQVFDEWFDRQPSTSRSAFCARVGLDPNRPYFLYVCSSRFVAPNETEFVRTWVTQLRQSSSPALRGVGVLVRPHPQHERQWRRFSTEGFRNFAVFPPEGAVPVDAQSKADYFDSICHSAGVVGINTTAEIESAIIGRSVYTLLAPEFRGTQEGTIHFHYLRNVGGGLLHAADTFPDHLAQLDAALCSAAADDGRSRRFVEAFVRPYGIDVPAAPKFVEAIEAAADLPRLGGGAPPVLAPLVRRFLGPIASRLGREAALIREGRALRLQQKRQEAKRRKIAELKKRKVDLTAKLG